MSDFLLEILSEEIPARMQAKASADLARLFEERIADAGLKADAIETFVTPRRLALIARGLPEATEAVSEEIKGPRAGAPPQALEGFLRKTGLARDRLVERDGIWFGTIEQPGRPAAAILAEAIPAIARAFPWPKSMRWGAESSSTESARWVRPLQNVVALLGDRVVDFEVAGVRSGAATFGHRFHHPGPITIGGAHDYVEKLRACHVIVDAEERKALIRKGAARAAGRSRIVPDEGLVAENAGLTEYPVALRGGFDADYLALPSELIQLTMRLNQKYFACIPPRDRRVGLPPAIQVRSGGPDDPPMEGDQPKAGGGGAEPGAQPPPSALRAATSPSRGGLTNRFVCVANIDSSDPAAVVAGNEKVLAARLADAKFFWDQDLKVPLEEQATKLGQITFHEKLGTMADKVERVAKLAQWLVQERMIQGVDAGEVAAAARLAKADLVSELVGEFPELQGVIGGYYARAQGLPDAVAAAIRDHYKPAGQGDEVPTDKVTVAVNIADRLDTLVSFFSIGEKPTGSRDPFALRRAALSFLQLLTASGLRLPLGDVLVQAAVLVIVSRLGALSSVTFPNLLDEDEDDHEITAQVGSFTYRHGDHVVVRWDSALTPNLERGKIIDEATELQEAVLDFFADRLKVQQREAGVRHDLIDAVFACRNERGGGEDDLVRLLARVKALQAFVESPAGADLLTGYRRAASILRKEGWQSANRQTFFSYAPDEAERALDTALDAAEPRAAAALEEEDYERAMKALASLRPAVDAFFDKVTVNDEDPVKRETRLNLLDRMRRAVGDVADFSKIEG
jgi:glycyl-tRNA synthetase beta chain